MSAYDAEFHWSAKTLPESRLAMEGLAEIRTTSVACPSASGSSPGGGETAPLRPGLHRQSDECDGSIHSPSLSPEGSREGVWVTAFSSTHFLAKGALRATLLCLLPFFIPFPLASPCVAEDEPGCVVKAIFGCNSSCIELIVAAARSKSAHGSIMWPDVATAQSYLLVPGGNADIKS